MGCQILVYPRKIHGIKKERYEMSKLLNRDFLNFGGLFYFYFMIWAIVLAFLPLWLKDTAHLDEAESGIVRDCQVKCVN